MTPEYTDQLVDLIYAAMLGEVPWQTFVEELGSGLPDGRATLFYQDLARAAGTAMLTSGMDSGFVRAFNETYGALNPWMPGAARRPVGLGVVAEQMLDPEQLHRTAYYNDFLRPEDCHSATGITVERSDGRLFLLSVLTSRDDPEANLDHARTLTRICPHLQRAFRHIRQSDGQTYGGQAAFDALGVGVIVVGEGGVCRRISELAQSLLESSHAFSVDFRGKLRASDGDLSAALQTMLQSEANEPKIHETLLLDEGMALRVLLVRIETEGLAAYLQGPTVIVLLDPLTGNLDGAMPDFRALQGLAALHRLTRAETEVLQAIASGLTVAQIAQLRGVTLETIRGQIKGLFAKTGTKRQAELVRLVLAPRQPRH